MRPLLLEITFDVPHALAFLAVFVAWGAIQVRLATGEPWKKALRRALESALTFGSRGSVAKADISVPGSLGTVVLALALFGLVKHPVKVPVFGYASMAFCGFTTTAIVGMRTGP